MDNLPLKSLQLVMDIDVTSSIGTSNMFKSLTHFDTHDSRMLHNSCKGLECIDSLTHVCVVLKLGCSDPLRIISLICNPWIRLLAFRVEDPHDVVVNFLEQHEIVDHQIVLLPIEITNWAMLGQGHMLMWQLAEGLVELPIPQNTACAPIPDSADKYLIVLVSIINVLLSLGRRVPRGPVLE
ncbi:uncharacterized protein F5147DRAFT_652955 [Suillus discolor]|uniref:Uncharacterized protein n=1 Tax=Suillus discolor TaxID=1912936 RepID=A0A9P7F5W4_9AGAM|nr:uncharacterized protein F5147DRAFT_652955 [Suillus discolor]KAG2108235.1 hypothetical protein F5147DRAFT_652955 [Suillus discolor]